MAVILALGLLSPGWLPDEVHEPLPTPVGVDQPVQVVAKPHEKPREAQRSHRTTRGVATWYRAPSRRGAAGPVLRRALTAEYGQWRGAAVLVCHAKRCLQVRLTDWCACGKRHGVPTLIDLPASDFRYLFGSTSAGVGSVTVGY